MKILLAALMCMVLNASQCFAIDGGPWGGGGGQVVVTGNYAGVLVPKLIKISDGPPPVYLPPDNSLSLFTLSVVRVGLATGVVATFRNGFYYPGTLQGVADPDSARVRGIFNATFENTYTFVEGSGTGITSVDYKFTYAANGTLDNVKVVANNNPSSTGVTRLRGTASINYVTPNDPHNLDFGRGNSGAPVEYKVRGFKQSEATS